MVPVVANAIERFLESAEVLGHPIEVRRFPGGTKTAQDAARAIGCDVGQIVKSLVFVADERPVLALTSGANRVDLERLARLTGSEGVRRASPEEAREATGFAVGGTPPFGHPKQVRASSTGTCSPTTRSGPRRARRMRSSCSRRPSSVGPPWPRWPT